jgi:hypothetical protein
MTSFHRATLIIHCGSCRGSAYGVAWPALRCHDAMLHLGARSCKAAPVQSQPIVRIELPPTTRENRSRSYPATTIIKSP